ASRSATFASTPSASWSQPACSRALRIRSSVAATRSRPARAASGATSAAAAAWPIRPRATAPPTAPIRGARRARGSTARSWRACGRGDADRPPRAAKEPPMALLAAEPVYQVTFRFFGADVAIAVESAADVEQLRFFYGYCEVPEATPDLRIRLQSDEQH